MSYDKENGYKSPVPSQKVRWSDSPLANRNVLPFEQFPDDFETLSQFTKTPNDQCESQSAKIDDDLLREFNEFPSWMRPQSSTPKTTTPKRKKIKEIDFTQDDHASSSKDTLNNSFDDDEMTFHLAQTISQVMTQRNQSNPIQQRATLPYDTKRPLPRKRSPLREAHSVDSSSPKKRYTQELVILTFRNPIMSKIKFTQR